MLKESIYNLRRQPVISIVTIAGTALSIFLIMVVVMMQQVRTAPYAPESNRDRFLHYPYISFSNSQWTDNPEESNSNGPMSWFVVKNLFYPLETPEAVTAYTISTDVYSIGVKGEKPFAGDVRDTDAAYFKVFDFKFVDGKPFSQEDFDASLPRAVIDTNVAARLFGKQSAVGRRFEINGGEYTVCGVVEPVSTLASHAYSQIWIPATTGHMIEADWSTLGGMFTVTILTREGGSEQEVRDEFKRRSDEFGKTIAENGWVILHRGRPYTQEVNELSSSSNNEPDIEGAHRRNLIIYAILLLVPAINLSSMTHSRLRRRVSEIAVRRAFGATRSVIFLDILTENFLVTLIGGIIGILMSVVAAFLFVDVLFSQSYVYYVSSVSVDVSMLLHWSTFGWALLFCFFLNMLSAGIPAMQMARIGLVNSLRGKDAGK